MIYTGRLIEREMFDSVEGKIDTSVEDIEVQKFYSILQDGSNISPEEKSRKRREYKFSLMKLVKESQPYDIPSDPEPRFSNDLHATLAEKLNLDDYSKLRIYTAVGSQLDKKFGVDAFIEYDFDKRDKYPITITLDVTLNRNKDEWKADVIIYPGQDGIDKSDHDYKEKLDQFADKIHDCIIKKIEWRTNGKFKK